MCPTPAPLGQVRKPGRETHRPTDQREEACQVFTQNHFTKAQQMFCKNEESHPSFHFFVLMALRWQTFLRPGPISTCATLPSWR